MKVLNFLLILGLLLTAACSNSKKQGEGGGDKVAAADEDYVEYILDDEEGDDAALDEDGGEELADSGEEGDDDEYYIDDEEDGGEELAASDEDDEDEEGYDEDDEDEILIASGDDDEVEITGDSGTYKVKSNETLMMVAFKVYGDYTMWRKLKNFNSMSGTSISSGQVLKYPKPSKKFVWNPEGLPYLIEHGDTLGTISNDKYGTSSQWKKIWNNNRPLIKNPDLIFAGFTLYYTSGDDRDIASEQ